MFSFFRKSKKEESNTKNKSKESIKEPVKAPNNPLDNNYLNSSTNNDKMCKKSSEKENTNKNNKDPIKEIQHSLVGQSSQQDMCKNNQEKEIKDNRIKKGLETGVSSTINCDVNKEPVKEPHNPLENIFFNSSTNNDKMCKKSSENESTSKNTESPKEVQHSLVGHSSQKNSEEMCKNNNENKFEKVLETDVTFTTNCKNVRKNLNEKENKPENATESVETTSNLATTIEKVCKNNQPSGSDELAPQENDAIALPKNVVNAAKSISNEAATFYEKNDNEVMSEYSYVNGLKIPEPHKIDRRGSCSVKPCGHGTTAIAPRVVVTGGNQNLKTPPSSPILEIKKNIRYKVNDIQETSEPHAKRVKESTEAELKTQVSEKEAKVDKIVRNGLEEQVVETKKNLINQEAKFQSQLNDLSKQLSVRDAEATKLRFEMEELQRDVFAKSAGMDRLQSELNAATKESELIRQKIRHLEAELENYRIRNAELVEDLKNKNEFCSNFEIETKSKINELEGVISNLRIRIQTLEDQIRHLKDEKQHLEKRHEELQMEREEEKKKLTEILESTAKQKEEIEIKWKEDFEKLRTINILKEQDLLDDFEWKLREVQQTCKKKMEDKDKKIEERLQEAYQEAQTKMAEAEAMLSQVECLRSYESEVKKLRGKTTEQDKALQEMRDQQQQMLQAEAGLKNETKRLLNLIEMEKENLQHIQRLHRQEILDKERKLKETLNQKRTEIAMYWEEKLLHECGRLKEEMEQIHDEEKFKAMEAVRRQKDEEFITKQNEWEHHLRECLKEVESLKKSLDDKDDFYHEELIRVRSNTDKDIMELRRLMDKIDMAHHENHEKLILKHEEEIEKLTSEHEEKLLEVEQNWQNKVGNLSATLDAARQKMEEENREKLEILIQQHRDELDSQWENLIHQKSEALNLVQQEYIDKYKTLEEQFYTQQKSHSAREVELLKTIDSLKNELETKNSTLDDLQNNVDTLEGGVQVLNQEIAQQNEDLAKVKNEADQKTRSLQQTIGQLLQERDKDKESFRAQLMKSQRQHQETIDHLQRKCQCLTKLFEEVRQRYERRESRQEDLNIISDLRQVIAEQEKDLACINEEKRFFQMRLMQLERHLEEQTSVEEEEFEDAHAQGNGTHHGQSHLGQASSEQMQQFGSNLSLNIPPTILECEDGEE